MKIEGVGDVPQGLPKWIVLGINDTSDGPKSYIGVKFDLGLRTQKHFGKIIEEVLYNPKHMARFVLDNVLSEDNNLKKELLFFVGELNPLSLTLRDIEFYSQENSKHIFNFTKNLYDRLSIKITTDIDLNPLKIEVATRGDKYYCEWYNDFKFYDLRYFKDMVYLNELKESVLWIEGLANKKSPRLNEYVKMLEVYENTPPGIISEEQIKISIAYLELEGLRIVYKAFKDRGDNLNEKVKNIIKGVAFKYKQEVVSDDKCRGFLYELKIAANFLLSGYNVDVSQRADVVINGNVFIECKKITSDKKIIDRIKDALEQIKEKEGVRNGIIYVDITDAIIGLKDIFLIMNNKIVSYFDSNGLKTELQVDRELRMDFFNKVNGYSISLINKNMDKICKILGDSFLVFYVELPILHLSPIHERMGIVKILYTISNRMDLKLDFIVESSIRSFDELYPAQGKDNNINK